MCISVYYCLFIYTKDYAMHYFIVIDIMVLATLPLFQCFL